MDQHSNSYSAYSRSHNDPTFSFQAPADGTVPTAPQNSGAFGSRNQPTAKSYPDDDGYQSYLTQSSSENTGYSWSGSYAAQGNYTAETFTVQTDGMDSEYEPASSQHFASSTPELETPETEPGLEWTGNDHQMPAQTKKQFFCLQANCKQKPFGRRADLDRHHKMVHNTAAPKPVFHCDYRRCPRAQDDAPFHRQDHFRHHFREYHKEDLVARGSKINSKEWWKTRMLQPSWWRCNKCLKRVSRDSDGWLCPNCRLTCDLERQRERIQRNAQSTRD